MPTYLTDITAEASTKLTASLNTELGSSGLTQAVKDAVRAYSERRPRRRRLNNGAGISVVSGTDSYDLPADFLAWEPVTWAAATDDEVAPIQVHDHSGYGRLDWNQGSGLFEDALTDVASRSPPIYTVYPGNPPVLIIDPEPASAATLKADYYAIHVLTDSECSIPQSDWGLIVIRSLYEGYDAIIRGRSINPISFEVAGGGNTQRVRMADPDKLQEKADRLLAEWERRIGRPLGVLG